ncbi:U6 snRNA phosphodiesterase [Culex quinquefasciatus]|uniref:U6 snRNA phosphodiesterase n=1 Tax=Culex quinquefasciatus TaxID=7176 RepID=UPI0018E35D2D|nr:U6 snRNA phosphodiesterase [Culex quinquefasciatus]
MHNIQQYSGDSSSEDDGQGSAVTGSKDSPKPDLLPTSKKLLQIEAATAEEPVDDDPAKHQGRVRSFAHERGIWASYVYVDYNDVEPLNDLQQHIIDKASKELSLELNRVDNLHLSLTKTFVIRHHNITAFVENIRNAVSGFKRFTVLPSNLAIYVNEEQTRTFLAVKIDETSFRPLEQLVDALDGCMREYKLPVFYQERSFHVSILWTLGNQRDKMEGILPELDELFNAIYEEEYCDMNVNVKRLHLKCGNKFYDFGLV